MTASARSHARARRARFTVVWIVTALSVTIACIVASMLADRYSARWDVTADRAHSLSARTRAVLGSLEAPVNATVIAKLHEMDRSVRDGLADLADDLTTASNDKVRVTIADAASPATADVISALVGRIADRDASVIAGHRMAITGAAGALERLADSLDSVVAPVRRLSDSLGATSADASRWLGAASAIGPLTTDVRTAARELPDLAHAATSGADLPEPDAAANAIASVISRVGEGLSAMAKGAGVIADRDSSGPLHDAATDVRDRSRAIADGAKAIGESLARLAPSDALRVARTLERAEAVIVDGPGEVVIRPVDALFATIGAGASARAVFAGEECLASAIGAAAARSHPMLVLVHAETSPVLDASRSPTPQLAGVCGRTLADITSRGWRLAEWSTTTHPITPDRTELGAGDDSPIVWFVLGSPGTATGDDIARTEAMSKGVRRLIDRGDALLISVLPSDLPGLGETDPIAAALGALGIDADTGRPVVTRTPTGAGPSYSVDQNPVADSDHPIDGALGDLPLTLRLALPLTIAPGADGVTAILEAPASPDRWGESNWRILGTPRASIEPPTPDAKRDSVTGPWTVAMAVDRASSGPGAMHGRQRAVVVAGALWYADGFTKAAIEVEGRRALIAPGNMQLLDASLAWLSGHDELIPPAPDVRDVPRIAALTEGQVSLVRWILGAAMPGAALACGVAVQVARRRSRDSAPR